MAVPLPADGTPTRYQGSLVVLTFSRNCRVACPIPRMCSRMNRSIRSPGSISRSATSATTMLAARSSAARIASASHIVIWVSSVIVPFGPPRYPCHGWYSRMLRARAALDRTPSFGRPIASPIAPPTRVPRKLSRRPIAGAGWASSRLQRGSSWPRIGAPTQSPAGSPGVAFPSGIWHPPSCGPSLAISHGRIKGAAAISVRQQRAATRSISRRAPPQPARIASPLSQQRPASRPASQPANLRGILGSNVPYDEMDSASIQVR